MTDLVSRAADTGVTNNSQNDGIFVCRGDYWTVMFAGQTALLRDGKGLQYLAALLRQPGRRVSVADLVGEPDLRLPESHTGLERTRSAVTKRIHDALQKIERNHAALGRHLRARVKTGYECIYSPDPDQPVVWEL